MPRPEGRGEAPHVNRAPSTATFTLRSTTSLRQGVKRASSLWEMSRQETFVDQESGQRWQSCRQRQQLAGRLAGPVLRRKKIMIAHASDRLVNMQSKHEGRVLGALDCSLTDG